MVNQFSDFNELDELTGLTSRTLILICKKTVQSLWCSKVTDIRQWYTFFICRIRTIKNDWDFKHFHIIPRAKKANLSQQCQNYEKKVKKSLEENEDVYIKLLLYRNTPKQDQY